MKIKVLNIRSLAYSGTTWITMVLASHRQALALGAGDRIFELKKNQADIACFVHGKSCTFWPEFIRNYNRKKNFILQLAEYSNRSVFVINNPSQKVVKSVFNHPDIDLVTLKQVRDGRATLYSWMRHHPHRYSEFYDAVRAWLIPAWQRLYSLDKGEKAAFPLLRYEDMIEDWQKEANRIGKLLGIEYEDDAVQYWRYDHHLPNGNTGTIDLLRRLTGQDGLRHHLRDQYDQILESTLKAPDKPVLDESWRDKLSPVDLAAYDFIAGELHEKFGYLRDVIDPEVMMEFKRKYQVPDSVEEAIRQIPSFSRQKQLKYRIIDHMLREISIYKKKLINLIGS